MIEAEEERQRMSSTIDGLEDERKELELSNARVIAENRDLLNQLEQLNSQIIDSDIEIQSLNSTLAATRLELQRLSGLTNRAEQLEKQLYEIEIDHADLLAKHATIEDENKTAIQRWKKAEGTIIYLQDQIDRIEREAQEERQRHVEVMGRLERRRAVERELEQAAGRLKGAAITKSLNPQPGTNVVSHFVRDILQDNANLQNGIVELREMLMGSNLEVENLREQLLLHQPVESRTSTLKAELGTAEIPTNESTETGFDSVPELHVHHHYHAPDLTVKRPRKKRPTFTSGHFTPGGTLSPRHRRSKDWRISTSSANTILSQTSVTVPTNRWSTQTTQTGYSYAPSSMPSSPRRNSSVFDPIDTLFDSRPSTPESSVTCCTSPTQPIPEKQLSTLSRGLANHRSISTPTPLLLLQTPQEPRSVGPNETEETSQALLRSPQPTILEEPDFVSDSISPDSFALSFSRPLHRRAASHESLFSLSESQRPLKSHASQVFDMTSKGFSPVAHSPITTHLSAKPTVVYAIANAARDIPSQKQSQDSMLAKSLLSQVMGPQDHPTTKKSSGNWVWGKWGRAPVPTPNSPQTPQNPLEAMLRSPGVNQSGWIRGLKPPKPTPSNIQPNQIDREALMDALGE